MKRIHILSTETKVADLTFEDLYDEISRDWQYKARRLQARRWRNLKYDTHGYAASTKH